MEWSRLVILAERISDNELLHQFEIGFLGGRATDHHDFSEAGWAYWRGHRTSTPIVAEIGRFTLVRRPLILYVPGFSLAVYSAS